MFLKNYSLNALHATIPVVFSDKKYNVIQVKSEELSENS